MKLIRALPETYCEHNNTCTSETLPGSQLQICPRGLTCCTKEIEQKMRSASRENYSKALQASANSIQKLFNTKANRFDGKDALTNVVS